MIYFADLHIHSKYSRACSRDCNLVELARWASLKGIRLLATGDFTHPAWRNEIKEMLVDAESGLFRLADGNIPETLVLQGGFGPNDVRFILNVEISSIYKKDGATRKVHNLIFMPDFDSMEKFTARLDRIGNINSDGRPILGLDSRDLLEIALETHESSFLIPAHIWTPWFSILGSRSGFDSVEECFGDLAPHIFALETGLSSDPEMNHRVSALDRFTLISNSDTHSPARLGREANIFQGDLGYHHIRDALIAGGKRTLDSIKSDSLIGTAVFEGIKRNETTIDREEPAFLGTIEFFPEEGKYHLDGHRKCGIRLDPVETHKLNDRCPVCGQLVTIGVMNRVIELADREQSVIPERGAPFWRLLTLQEIVAQSLGVGPQSKKVNLLYQDLLRNLGPELIILWALPLEEIAQHAPDIVTESIRRVRSGELSIEAGFDGEYGTVKLFGEGEREHIQGQSTFVPVQSIGPRKAGKKTSVNKTRKKQKIRDHTAAVAGTDLNEEQDSAIRITDRPVLVQAGPGTGKTRTLIHRICHLIRDCGADPETMTAVTFTRKASREIRERLEIVMGKQKADKCWSGTFHQLGTRILDIFEKRGQSESRTNILTEDAANKLFRSAVIQSGLDVSSSSVASLRKQVSLLKQNMCDPNHEISDPILSKAYGAYEDHLRTASAWDLDDLLLCPANLLKEYPAEAREIREAIAVHLLVDEFQDVNRAQYEMVRLLSGPMGRGLFVIGDPNQAIYGFRGADRKFFFRFSEDYSDAARVGLFRNYRSQKTILDVAQLALSNDPGEFPLNGFKPAGQRVTAARLPNPGTEAEFVIRRIDACLGGSSFFSLDSRELSAVGPKQLGFKDFAVLFRLNSVGDLLEETFRSSGIPFQRAKKSIPEEEAEALDPRAEAVTLMTIHAAKGLEFPIVFVAGCEDGIIPYLPAGESTISLDELDEERRILYVAMTRAQDELYLTRSEHRILHGRNCRNPKSRFLDKIDDELCDFISPLDNRPFLSRKPQQCDLFS
ncbi:MAG: UvrD-helicase domain-containing protein [Desulfomonilaceae bacterium]